MAVELPARRPGEAPATGPVALSAFGPVATRFALPAEGNRWPRLIVRSLEALTGALALVLISTLVWGYIWFPGELAVALLETLDWNARYADIETILTHALEWERKLQSRNWA